MKKSRVYMGLFALCFMYSGRYLLPYIKNIFYDAVAAATGFTHTQIGLCLSVYIIASNIFLIVGGYLADRYEPKKIMLTSCVFNALFSFGTLIFIRNFYVTIALYFGLGVTNACGFWSPVFKAISLLGKRDEQGRLYGLFDSLYGLMAMLISFIGLWIYANVSADPVVALKGVYLFYSILVTVSIFVLAMLYKPLPREEMEEEELKKKATNRDVLNVLKMPRVWVFSLLVLGVYGFYSGSGYLTPYFSTVLGVSIAFSGVLATIKTYGLRIVGSSFAAFSCDRIGRLKFMLIGLIICVAFMVVFMMLPASSSMLVPIIILMLAMSTVNLAMKGIELAALDDINVSRSVNGTAIAIATLVGMNCPDILLPIIFGSILDHNDPVPAYKMIFSILVGILVVGIIASIVLLRIKKNDEKKLAEAAVSGESA